MVQTLDLTAAALRDDWAQLTEVGAAVRHCLDDALADLVCSAVEDSTASFAENCARIDRVFDARMAPYRDLGWALDQAAALKHALKEGLRQGPCRTDKNELGAGRA